MAFLWGLVIIVSALFEGITAGLISLWFVIGGIVSFILSILGVKESVQIPVFIIISILSMIALRPFVKKTVYKKGEKNRTNVDRLIGNICIVTEQINNLKNTGEVRINGQRWSAKILNDDATIEVGTKVEIIDIEGVKLLVQPSEDGSF